MPPSSLRSTAAPWGRSRLEAARRRLGCAPRSSFRRRRRVAAHAAAQAPSCTHTVGVVVELTGPAGRFGQAAVEIGRARVQRVQRGRGRRRLAGCQLAFDLRDSQSQGTVAVDQARQLVDLKNVPAIIGGII